MNRQAVHALMRALGSKEVRDHGNWVTGSCPFAPYLHHDKRDIHPSFGISVDTHSSFHCFACDKKGRLRILPTLLTQFSGRDQIELRRFMAKNESAFNLKESKVKEPEYVPIEEEVLEDYPKLTTNFGAINLETIERWDLRYDDNEGRVIFPVRDSKQNLVALRGRFTGIGGLRYRTYSELQQGDDAKKCGVWYGEDFPLVPDRPLFLVEGERDAVLLSQGGITNVWSAMGASITKRQLNKLASVRNTIVCFFDQDAAGESAYMACKNALQGIKIPRKVPVEAYFGCNDPAEIVEQKKLDKFKRFMVDYLHLKKKGG